MTSTQNHFNNAPTLPLVRSTMLDGVCSELQKLAAKVGQESNRALPTNPANGAYLAASAHRFKQAATAINGIYQPWNGNSPQTAVPRPGR